MTREGGTLVGHGPRRFCRAAAKSVTGTRLPVEILIFGEANMGFFDKLKKITANIFSGFTEADEAFFEELEETLILADLGMDTAVDAVERLRARVRREKIHDQEGVRAALRDVLMEEMNVGETALNLATTPSVVLFIGVNGVGKTTSIGKLGSALRAEGKQGALLRGGYVPGGRRRPVGDLGGAGRV